ncbi:hypothetical protein A0J61_04206 [Choanephora cucurbitarum]|uniref:Transcription regulator Rua1 C-terminal domain-containing protein n=1 Tax=Choanephora cucurbitarum TaxID=101091 RepID=A0A1C7NF73_9FUNG|nr:hypothetical protein A0J61_04206 [Choanephora cucurbitarum]
MNYPITQPDIYAILSTDDPVDVEGSEHIDADALVMNMFNTPYNTQPTSQPEFRFPNTSPAIQRVMMEDHPLSPHTPPFTSSVQLNPSTTPQPYTLSDSSFQFPEPNSLLSRRHSVAVSGGLTELRRAAPPGFQPQVRTPLVRQQPPSYTPRKTQLSTVMESHTPHMGHRASMPNIFLPERPQRPKVESMSAKTTPTNTPPPVSIQFNAMPWSTEPSESANLSQQQQQSFVRKRFYSQQYDSINPIPFYNAPTLSQQSSNLCPFPMSGITSRRASVATPQDISTWNHMVDPSNRIVPPPPPPPSTLPSSSRMEPTVGQKRVREKDSDDNDDIAPRKEQKIQLEILEESSAEDYPVITDADLDAAKRDTNAIPRRQKLRFEGDEYTPKWVRYTGQLKEGYCDTCQPGKWLQLKNSAFWYHKQFFHGISSVSGKPFQQPLEQQSGENDVVEGLCHQCHQYVPICNSKRKNSVLWYRHAHKCHIYDKPKPKTLNKRASISPSSNLKFENNNDQPQKIY